MRLNSLILTNFKNYELQRIDCQARLNCFLGRNGMGKTNLLDAIYYLCMGKSHFNVPDSSVTRHGADFFRLEGAFTDEERKEHIVAKVIPRKKKEVERNGKPYQRLSEHVGLIPVVIITPDDTQLITEGSEVRRRFMDNTLSQLDSKYLQELITYNRILKQRNAALKQMGETRSYNANLIRTYDEQLADPARFIFEKRKAFLDRFRITLLEMHRFISGQAETVDCSYRSQLEHAPIETLLQQFAEKDRVLERTTAGIHKDDLVFLIGEHPLKRFGSQGQLKSFLLALKLAQYEILKFEKKMAPLLLLDDIFDKLDRQRVTQLLNLILEGEFGQIFLTDTEEDRIEAIVQNFETDYCKFVIKNGKVDSGGPGQPL